MSLRSYCHACRSHVCYLLAILLGANGWIFEFQFAHLHLWSNSPNTYLVVLLAKLKFVFKAQLAAKERRDVVRIMTIPAMMMNDLGWLTQSLCALFDLLYLPPRTVSIKILDLVRKKFLVQHVLIFWRNTKERMFWLSLFLKNIMFQYQCLQSWMLKLLAHTIEKV